MVTITYSLLSQDQPIYLISDVHSNFPALKAVLNEIPRDAVIICAGDILGYYLEPNEVCDLLQNRSVLCIQGNHDKYVLGELDYPATRENQYRIIATRQSLTPANRKWLAALPDFLLLDIKQASESIVVKIKILVAHGSLRNVEEYVYPDTAIDFLVEQKPDFLILGHTHHPMLRQAGARLVVNPGSVGQARDWIPGACYASVKPFSGSVNFYRATYSLPAYQNQLKSAGVDSSMINILSRHRQ